MPKSPISKPTRRAGNPKSRTKKTVDLDDYLSQEEFKVADGSDDEAESANSRILKAVRHKLEQKSRKPPGHSAAFHSRKNTLYASARNNAREIVSHSVNAMEGIQAMLSEMRTQEIGLQKYHADCQPVISSNKDTFEHLTVLYSPICKDLGKLRAKTLEAASTMLKCNSSRRDELLTEVSKRARHQLEQAKQQEKTAEDAAELIDRFKKLIRTA